MRLSLYVLGRLAARTLASFLVIVGAFALLAVLDLARREPRLGGFAALEVGPALAIYSAGSALLAALAAGAAGTFAELARNGELTAAGAAGVGPPRWIACLGCFAAALAPWMLHYQAEVFPAARAAKNAEPRALLRSPDACARWIEARPALARGLVVSFGALRQGQMEEFRALELGPDELPRAAWWASRAQLGVPDGRDVLELALERATTVREVSGAGVERLAAAEVRMALPMRELARRGSESLRSRVGERDLAELGRSIRALSDGPERSLARAERAGRIGFVAALFSVCFGGAALGLLLAGLGTSGATLAGVAFVGGIYLPLHATALRCIAAGAPEWVRLLVDLLVGGGALVLLIARRGN